MDIITLSDDQWDVLLERSPYSSFFHSSFWKNNVLKTLGGTALLLKYESKKGEWLVPVYQGAPWSKGFRMSSIGYGGPLPLFTITEPSLEQSNTKEIIACIEKKINLKCTGYATFPLSIWSELTLRENEFLSQTQILQILCNPNNLFENIFSGNVRTAIRRAWKEEMVFRRINEQEIDKAYQLLVITQKNVKASYITSYDFFKLLANHPNKGIEVWAGFDKSGLMVVMSMFLYSGISAFHLFNGWDRAFAPTGANQALIWEMIKRVSELGAKSFNFGESHLDSLRKAKERWGSQYFPILKANF